MALDFGLSWAGRERHQLASTEPDMFIQGPKMAGASVAEELFRTAMARTEAMPPFYRPTSIATVRQDLSSRPSRRLAQYPRK
jgi:hypothetical protein